MIPEEPTMKKKQDETEGVAYSYVRFSDPSQAAGDSLRRQTQATGPIWNAASIFLRKIKSFESQHRETIRPFAS
jgi:hypothetical protein